MPEPFRLMLRRKVENEHQGQAGKAPVECCQECSRWPPYLLQVLVITCRNEKSAFADIFDKPCRFQNHDNLDSKPLRNREINLDRKYNVPLSIKYATLKEAESIAQQKKASE